ncbi:biotin-dependent carboxyltransferase family protein [Chloroflexus sp. Y-396-1]|uniref:5-oxoprolinase subunit C family protein n=1 Tax=Chloroflexus sp. Y-396-1 TaxID=867845 RepID=UPI00048C4CE2|nr:biotin-dependent carboxyltransferase family protein [Chloroflexus sp. Y-396-1]
MPVATIDILASGPLLTIQDGGRLKTRRYGVPVGGAMDRFALAAANRLVGNPAYAPALELTAGGVRIRFNATMLISLTGADLQAQLDEQPLAPWQSILARQGSLLSVHGRRRPWGGRAYLAIAGELEAEWAVGGAGTCLSGGFGGYQGRAIRSGDRISIRLPSLHYHYESRWWPIDRRPPYSAQPRLRVLPGPQRDVLPAAWEQLLNQSFAIDQAANRQGYRLNGAALPTHQLSLPSFGVLPGAIQLPPDGQPILLMADAQPTGGYPVIAVVISADLPLAAQLLPGDRLSFTETDLETAHMALAEQAAWLALGPEDEESSWLLDQAGALG